MSHYRYHGQLIQLANRITRLPNEEDLSGYKEGFQKYAMLDARMPIKDDIITIAGHEGEWLVYESVQARTWNWRQCHAHQVTGRGTQLEFGQYISLRIAYDESGLEPDFFECLNKRQAMHDAISIVGQAHSVTAWVRVPDIPPEMELVDRLE